MTSFVRGSNGVLSIVIVTCECAILIIRKLQLRVYHHCYCLLIYDDTVILLCFFLNWSMVQWRNGWWLNCEMAKLRYRLVVLFLTNIEDVHFLIFKHNIFAADKEIHNFHYLVTNNNYSDQVYVIKPSDHHRGQLIVAREIITLI